MRPLMSEQWRTRVFLVCTLCMALACEREKRRFDERLPAAQANTPIESSLQPGPMRVTSANDTPVMGVSAGPLHDPYGGNAYAIAQGQKLFEWYHCSGCHSHGGGGIGPALMDSVWIYGSDPSVIFQTIVGGRPDGKSAGVLAYPTQWSA